MLSEIDFFFLKKIIYDLVRFTGHFCGLLGSTRTYLVLMASAGIYWALLVPTGLCWDLLRPVGLYWCLQGFFCLFVFW